MLTDAAIKALKPREKSYKVTDRDGMYLLVMPSGAMTFRFDYRLILLCHKFVCCVVRWQHGQRGKARAIARAMAIRTDVIEFGT